MNNTCIKCNLEKSSDSFHKKKTAKSGYSNTCKDCSKEYMKKQHLVRRSRPENVLERERLRQLKRESRVPSTFNKKEYSRQYCLKHKTKLNAQSRARRDSIKDTEEFKLHEKHRKHLYYLENKHKFRVLESKRRFNENNAKLKCLTKEDQVDIATYYLVREQLLISTGVDYQVDHIVPITNKDVCGLHLPWNLRLLPANLNKSKSNKFIQELAIDYSAEWYRLNPTSYKSSQNLNCL